MYVTAFCCGCFSGLGLLSLPRAAAEQIHRLVYVRCFGSRNTDIHLHHLLHSERNQENCENEDSVFSGGRTRMCECDCSIYLDDVQ